MMKKSGQARQLDENLSNGAKEQRSVLNMVMLKESERELDRVQGSGAREQQALHCYVLLVVTLASTTVSAQGTSPGL